MLRAWNRHRVKSDVKKQTHWVLRVQICHQFAAKAQPFLHLFLSLQLGLDGSESTCWWSHRLRQSTVSKERPWQNNQMHLAKRLHTILKTQSRQSQSLCFDWTCRKMVKEGHMTVQRRWGRSEFQNKGRAVSSEHTWSMLWSQLKVMMLVTFLRLYCPTHFSGEVYSTSSWSSAHKHTHNNNNNNNKENFECLTFLKCIHNHDKQSYKACSWYYCTVITNQNTKLQYSSTVTYGKLTKHIQTHIHTHTHTHTHTHMYTHTHTHICTHRV